ncbi:MAG: HEPN domain-containing protein [bacterium]|nr:HEPN domain-containing protein [candidate division KSB1 bacterium]MDH7559853.1 HEPN domain-containing protein [bacterium]
MTNTSLAQAYLTKAQKRLLALRVLLQHEAYSDVVREAQEVVELALKGMLRQAGVEPPKWHDVGALLVEQRERFPEEVRPRVEELARISSWLRKEREFSFYGDVDFVPTERYSRQDAERALDDAELVVQVASLAIPK